jgi:hypothetical protein
VTGVAPSAWEAFRGRVFWLHEQDAPREEILRRIGQHVSALEAVGASSQPEIWNLICG